MNGYYRLAVLLVAFQVAVGSAVAYPLIQHTGANNPTSEGFAAVLGVGANAGTVGPLTPDGATGINSWQILTTNSTAFDAYVHDWTTAETNTLAQLGWALHLRLRVTTTNDTADGGMQVEMAFANKGYVIDFGSDASGNPTVGLLGPSAVNLFSLPTSTYTVSGAAGQYVTYSLIDTNQSGTFRLFANGADTGLSTTGFTDGNNRIYFGDGNGTGGVNGGANWNLVLLEVPEPSSLVLLSLGLLAVFRRRA